MARYTKGCGPYSLGSPNKQTAGGDPPEIPFTKEDIRDVVKSGDNTRFYARDGRTYGSDEFTRLNPQGFGTTEEEVQEMIANQREGDLSIYMTEENYPYKSVHIDSVDSDGAIHGFWVNQDLKNGPGSTPSMYWYEYDAHDFVVPAQQKTFNLPRKDWRTPREEPKLVDPFPEIYSRKMNPSGTKAIYETSKGTIVTAKDQNTLTRLRKQGNSQPKNTLNLPTMLDSDFRNTWGKKWSRFKK